MPKKLKVYFQGNWNNKNDVRTLKVKMLFRAAMRQAECHAFHAAVLGSVSDITCPTSSDPQVQSQG